MIFYSTLTSVMRAMTFIFFDGHFWLVPPKIKILFITYSFSACTFIFYIVNMILILNHHFFFFFFDFCDYSFHFSDFFFIFPIILFTFPTTWLYFCLSKFICKQKSVLWYYSIAPSTIFGTTRTTFFYCID